MTIPTSTEQTVADHADKYRRLMTDLGTLSGSLKPDEIKNFDFPEFYKALDGFSKVNDDLITATDAANGGFFATTPGRVIHNSIDVGGIVIAIGGTVFIIKSYVDNPNTDPSMIKAALIAVATLIIRCVKDLWKNYNDNKALVVAKNPPENPSKIAAIKPFVEKIEAIATSPEGQELLHEIPQLAAQLPSRGKKQFTPRKLGQIAKLADKLKNQFHSPAANPAASAAGAGAPAPIAPAPKVMILSPGLSESEDDEPREAIDDEVTHDHEIAITMPPIQTDDSKKNQ